MAVAGMERQGAAAGEESPCNVARGGQRPVLAASMHCNVVRYKRSISCECANLWYRAIAVDEPDHTAVDFEHFEPASECLRFCHCLSESACSICVVGLAQCAPDPWGGGWLKR